MVIFDDFRKGTIKFEALLNLCDKFPMDVSIKGSSVPWNPKIIVITCPRLPREEFTTKDMLKGGQKEVYEDVA